MRNWTTLSWKTLLKSHLDTAAISVNTYLPLQLRLPDTLSPGTWRCLHCSALCVTSISKLETLWDNTSSSIILDHKHSCWWITGVATSAIICLSNRSMLLVTWVKPCCLHSSAPIAIINPNPWAWMSLRSVDWAAKVIMWFSDVAFQMKMSSY